MSSPVSLPLPKDEWKLKVNAQYQEAIKILANLVTASLVLPILFVKNFIGLKDNQSVAPYLHFQAYGSWILLFLSLVCGMAFFWSSAKYVKVVSGGEESFSEATFEGIRDSSILGMVLNFLMGLVFLFWFFLSL
jgi:hypothetical protein